MLPALLKYIFVLLSQNSSWVKDETLNCLTNLTVTFFNNNDLVLISDSSTEFKIDFKSLYQRYIPPKGVSIEVIIISKNFSWNGPDLHGKIILVTENLDPVLSLWTKFKIVDILVVLQKPEQIEIYTWFPYREEHCTSDLKLKLVNVWKQGLVENSIKFSSLPKQFSRCPLKVTVTANPPFIFQDTNGERSGIEIDVLYDLARHVNMTLIQIPVKNYSEYFTYYIKDGKYYGMFEHLHDRTIDIAASCVSMSLDKMPFEFLPSHVQETVTWFLPGPRPRSLAYGFMTAFTLEMWIIIFLSMISVIIFTRFITPDEDWCFNITWTFVRFLGLPNQPLTNNFIIKLFCVTLELAILVLTALYRSLILIQLYKSPMFVISTAEEGLENNLNVALRLRDKPYINQTDLNFWAKVLTPGKYSFSLRIPFEEFLMGKSAMFLGRKILDEASIRLLPNVNYKADVVLQKDHFMTVDVAFFLPPNHPLFHTLSVKMLNILAAGLPNLYLFRALDKLPGRGYEEVEDKHKPLGLSSVVTLFYLLFALHILSIIILGIEKMYFKFGNKS